MLHIVAFHSLMDREMHTFTFSRRREVEDKAYHEQTTAGGGAYRNCSRGMRASSRAPSDLWVILQVCSSFWLIVVPRLSPLFWILAHWTQWPARGRIEVKEQGWMKTRSRESLTPLLEQSLPFVSQSRSQSTRHGRRYACGYSSI